MLLSLEFISWRRLELAAEYPRGGGQQPEECEHRGNVTHCCFSEWSPIGIVENTMLGLAQSHHSHSKDVEMIYFLSENCML